MSSYEEDIDYEGMEHGYNEEVEGDENVRGGNSVQNTYSDIDNDYDNMKINQKSNFNNKKSNNHNRESESAHSSDQESSSSMNSHKSELSEEVELSEEEKLQEEIMNVVIEMEESTPYQSILFAIITQMN